VPSPSLHDGRFANEAWLQELPDPLTKLTWDNPALVSPKTAETLGVGNQDVVKIEYAGRPIELPIWIHPDPADHHLAVTLGSGRRRAGRVGRGVGCDAFPLRSSKAPGFDGGVTVTKLGRTYPLSATQNHGSMEGRPLVRESTLAELRSPKPEGEAPGPLGVFETNPRRLSLFNQHTYDTGQQWGMRIDLNGCVGCNACMTACQSEHNVPVVGKKQVANGREMHWLRVDRYDSGAP